MQVNRESSKVQQEGGWFRAALLRQRKHISANIKLNKSAKHFFSLFSFVDKKLYLTSFEMIIYCLKYSGKQK